MANNGGDRQAIANEYGIEHMKRLLLPSMSGDMEAAPKLLKESAGKSSCCIFWVPKTLAGRNAEACWPRVISIGPYHHGEPQLQMLEEHKWRYLRAMLYRIRPHGIGLRELIDVVARKEEMIRQCYSVDTDNFSGPNLVKMMVLDGCFIIELLLRTGRCVQFDPDDPLLTNSHVFASLVRDLLRLENQVPYLVLEDLMEIASFTSEALAGLALNFFNCTLETPVHAPKEHRNLTPVHLLDLFRLSLIPSDRQNISRADESSSYESIGSASELLRKGIFFKQRQDRTILEIRFDAKKKIIEIPRQRINDTRNCVILNMVAFEQCYGHCDKHVTAYAVFMGCLVQTAEDARLLLGHGRLLDPDSPHNFGVIRYDGASEEDIARSFGDVCRDASCDVRGSYLASTFAGVNKYLREEKVGIWAGFLMYYYFDNPWTSVSLLFSLLSATGVIQTVYAILQYYHPK